jgi:hypothetical protein
MNHHFAGLEVPLLDFPLGRPQEDVPPRTRVRPPHSRGESGRAGEKSAREGSVTHHRRPGPHRARHRLGARQWPGRRWRGADPGPRARSWGGGEGRPVWGTRGGHLATVLMSAALCDVHGLANLHRLEPATIHTQANRSRRRASRGGSLADGALGVTRDQVTVARREKAHNLCRQSGRVSTLGGRVRVRGQGRVRLKKWGLKQGGQGGTSTPSPCL